MKQQDEGTGALHRPLQAAPIPVVGDSSHLAYFSPFHQPYNLWVTLPNLRDPALSSSQSTQLANAVRSLAANCKCQFTQMGALPSHSWKWTLASPGLWPWWPCHLGQVLTRREKEGAPLQTPPGLVRLGAESPVQQVGSGWPGWLGVGSIRGQVQGLVRRPPVLSELALGPGTWEMARGF